MSSILATTGFAASVVTRDDFSACDWAANGDLFGAKLWDRIPADDYLYDAHFESEWWPARSSMMGGWDGEPSNLLLGEAQWWGWPQTRSGCNGRLGFVGYTRDAYGSPVGGCTVRCFNTATNELVSTVTSDANGFYIATTPYGGAHYLVVHKSGTPEIAGASISTLTPA